MTNYDLIKNVQKLFDNAELLNTNIDWCLFDNPNAAVAMRMINAYKRYTLCKNQESQMEFECVLRNYLLFLKTDITINGYNLTDPNKFGLTMNNSNGKIYANLDLPSYLNDGIVRNVFDCLPVKNMDSSEDIKVVNPYIYELTNHRFKAFKSIEQQIAVMGALRVPDGYTALVAMSTGGGKSLITQTVSYQYRDSLTLIIVPTVSLMIDQQKNALNIISPANKSEIMYYCNGSDVDQLISALENKSVRMLFISPETLIRNQRIQKSILSANNSGYLKNLVIDEAHIIVEWGALFRVDFQCLDSFRKNLLSDNPNLRTFLLSATFSKKTVDDLKLFYSDNDRWIEIRLDSLRKEPRFDIIRCNSYNEKLSKLKELVCKLPRPMIIYVNTPDDADNIRNELAELGFDNTRVFTGRTNTAERDKIISEWESNIFDLMIATCAFGVGVDKKDVRTVLHLYVPSGADQYYQECGRGGRDGLPCLSIMLYTYDDIKSAVSMTQKVITSEKLSGRWFSMVDSQKANIQFRTLTIDTSVKPNYNDDVSYYDDVNNADIKWNVNVILLLRRAGLIKITDVKYINEKYIFSIELVDRQLRFNDEKTNELLKQIRDEESKKVSSEISELASKLRNVGKSCWSSMFNDIYLLTDEYCAGCNYHSTIISDKISRFPLKKPIVYPVLEPKGRIKEMLLALKEMLIICQTNALEVIKTLFSFGADLLVLPDDSDYLMEIMSSDAYSPTQFCIGYKEFFELSRINCDYFLSGNIVFYFENNSKLADRVLNISSSKEYNRIYVVNSDFPVSDRGKNISELVNGACKYDYIIMKEMK